MRINEMVQREDFFKILKDTVVQYYKEVFNKDIMFKYTKDDELEQLIINYKMSFVSRRKTPLGLKKFLLAEYNIRGNVIKHIIGKLIACAVCVFPKLGTHKIAYISAGAIGKNVFISPQNRSIRFFNYDTMTVDCIIKNGFSRYFFNNQIEFRKKYNYKFMVPMIDSGDIWFREPILSGHPLARTTEKSLYEKGMTDAINAMHELADDTYQCISATDYAIKLENKINKLISEAAKGKEIHKVVQLCKIVKTACNTIKNSAMDIPTVLSHGDLQSGNIWVDNDGNVLIYDWETVARRSAWYDASVLNYSLRRVYGWKEFIEDSSGNSALSCDNMKKRSTEEIYVVKNVVLLEDIIFYLEDMIELPSDWGKDIFNDFLTRITELLEDETRIPKKNM